MTERYNFFDRTALKHRISHGIKRDGQEVIFLLGAGLSSPETPGSAGVPDANNLIKLIRNEFTQDPVQLAEFDRAIEGSEKRCPAAFFFLQGRLGQSAANEIVRKAVLMARLDWGSLAIDPRLTKDEEWRILDMDSKWAPNPGTRAVGKLVTNYPKRFGRTLLTTNFDPLIEVAIRMAGGQFFKTALHADGNLSQTEASGCHVVHLHGYWYGSDTLHTTSQIQQSRPHLKASLTELLRNKLVVISGYGGWDDIFTDALIDVARDDSASPEVLWTFHAADPKISESLGPRLAPGISRGRVSLYAGIDCNAFFPEVQEAWEKLEGGSLPPKIHRTNPVRVDESLRRELKKTGQTRQVVEGDDEDRPPIVKYCVGRERELLQLQDCDARAVFLTGIGGQGKSTLAAEYFAACQATHKFSHFVWRDCKEEGERFENQIASIIESLSGGVISGRDLAKQDASSVVQLLLAVTRHLEALFIFDNADHYVNLESARMTASPDLLIQALLSSDSRSRILLTCRPRVKYNHDLALSIHLEGISLKAASLLFSERGAQCTEVEIAEAHRLTDGHAFWLDLLSIQVANRPSVSLEKLLQTIGRGQGLFPDNTLNSIWATLKDREQLVLRSMAETVRPETENEIAGYLQNKINYHKVIKALNALRTLNLIVIKRLPEHDVLELHPLVRQFIRQKFSSPERSTFIEAIIKVYNRFIGNHRGQLTERPTLSLLQNWTQMVELDIAAGRIKEGFQNLYEVASAFGASAYPREFCRTARLLLGSIDWVADYKKYKEFDGIFRTNVVSLANLGEIAEVDTLLEKFEMTVVERDYRYILYCEMKCHCKWVRGQFADAVKWGKIGQALKVETNVDTSIDVAYSLALAERDAGRPELALPVFLTGRKLSEVIDPDELNEKWGGARYGNVGRCLHFMGQIDDALVCYQKSALLIEKDPENEHVLNQGFVRKWVAELLVARKEYKLAGIFFEAARLRWELVSPPRAADISMIQAQLSDQAPRPVGMSELEIQRVFQDWMLGRTLDDELTSSNLIESKQVNEPDTSPS